MFSDNAIRILKTIFKKHMCYNTTSIVATINCGVPQNCYQYIRRHHHFHFQHL